jgi:uncharacterized protein (TIGR02246 family)
MKKTEASMGIIYTLLLIVLSACATSIGARGAGANQQVAAATSAWHTAYNSRDPAAITSMYASDAVLWGTAAKKVAANPSAIADYFKDAGKRPAARVTFGEQHIRVYGDTAVNTGYYTFSDIREGKEVLRPARYTMVFRERDGRWLLVAHHSSEVPR